MAACAGLLQAQRFVLGMDVARVPFTETSLHVVKVMVYPVDEDESSEGRSVERRTLSGYESDQDKTTC